VTGDEVEYDVASFAAIPALSVGEIVTVTLEDGLVIAVDVRIDDASAEYEVVSVDIADEEIMLDIGGTDTRRFLSKDLLIFGDTRVRSGDMISFDVNADNELEVILVIE
jgi:hypothetical protein